VADFFMPQAEAVEADLKLFAGSSRSFLQYRVVLQAASLGDKERSMNNAVRSLALALSVALLGGLVVTAPPASAMHTARHRMMMRMHRREARMHSRMARRATRRGNRMAAMRHRRAAARERAAARR
jgi:hypothetical protein